MNKAREADMREMAGGTEYAFEVPDGFGAARRGRGSAHEPRCIWGKLEGLRFRIYFVEKATAIVFVKDAGEAPGLLLEGLHVLDLNDENVSRLSILYLKWP